MKIKEFLTEAKPNTSGHHRLVSSIWNQISGRKPSREAIEAFLKRLDGDEAFMSRVKAKARRVGNPGYLWASIRSRSVSHFAK